VDRPSLREALSSASWATIFTDEIVPVVRSLRRSLLHTDHKDSAGYAAAFAKFQVLKHTITGMYRKVDKNLPLPDSIIQEFDLPDGL
jgi:hypothetical protein